MLFVGLFKLGIRFTGPILQVNANVLHKLRRNIKPSLNLLRVENRLELVAAITITGHVGVDRSHCFSSRLPRQRLLLGVIIDLDRRAADTALSDAARIATGQQGNRGVGADLAVVRHRSARRTGFLRAVGSTSDVFAHAPAQANAAGVVGGFVLDVGAGERAGGKRIFPVFHRLIRAGNDGAIKVGIALYIDLEAAITRLDTGLLADTGVVAVHFLLVERRGAADAVAERWNADADADACIDLFRAELAGVLKTGQVQVATDIGLYLLGSHHCALEVGIVAAVETGFVAGFDRGIGLRDVMPVGHAHAFVRSQVQREAVLRAADC